MGALLWCKSRRMLFTASEAKRNCMRLAECGGGSVEGSNDSRNRIG
ncbi:hypothetical protein SAMN05216315_11451 [Nitrosospira sp. Nsp18]|nr:hypothetical protein SAMN05216315_11451 [Nitrosospira sp. Nsp18]